MCGILQTNVIPALSSCVCPGLRRPLYSLEPIVTVKQLHSFPTEALRAVKTSTHPHRKGLVEFRRTIHIGTKEQKS